MKLYHCLLATALVLTFPGGYARAQTAEEKQQAHLLVRQAREYIRTMEADKAMKLLDQALKLDSTTVEVHLKRSDALFDLERFTDSIAEANSALKIDPKNADALYRRGTCYTEQKKYQLALTDIERSLSSNPGQTAARLLRGQLLQLTGKTEAEGMAPGDSETPTIFLQCAEAFRRKGDRVRERAELSRLIAAYPKSVDGYRLRGDSFYKDGQFAPAAADYKRALQIEPDNEHCSQYLKLALTKKH